MSAKASFSIKSRVVIAALLFCSCGPSQDGDDSNPTTAPTDSNPPSPSVSDNGETDGPTPRQSIQADPASPSANDRVNDPYDPDDPSTWTQVTAATSADDEPAPAPVQPPSQGPTVPADPSVGQTPPGSVMARPAPERPRSARRSTQPLADATQAQDKLTGSATPAEFIESQSGFLAEYLQAVEADTLTNDQRRRMNAVAARALALEKSLDAPDRPRWDAFWENIAAR